MVRAPERVDNLRQKWAAAGFVLVFALLALVLIGLTRWSFVDENLILPYTRWLARLSGHCFAVFGVPVNVQDTFLRHSAFAVDIRRGCDGVVATIVLLSALLAFPASWRDRLRGAVMGFALIFVLNLVRIFVLFGLGIAGQMAVFNFVHTYVAQMAVIAAAMVFWVYWTGTARPRRS